MEAAYALTGKLRETVAKITPEHAPDVTFRTPYQRMFMGMTPGSDHRFFLPRHGLVFEASWRRPARTGRGWLRAHLHALTFGGPTPGSPEHEVDPEALTAAVELVEEQDIDAAAMAFTELGYVVQVHAPR